MTATLAVGESLTITMPGLHRPPPIRSADPAILTGVASTSGRVEFRAAQQGQTAMLADLDACVDVNPSTAPCVVLNVTVSRPRVQT